jgi:hypothetical protein
VNVRSTRNRNWKLDKAHLKSEIRNCKLDLQERPAVLTDMATAQRVQFKISDFGREARARQREASIFEMGFRPISKFF